MGRVDSYAGLVAAAPADVLAAITGISSLPVSNDRIERTIEEPARLERNAELLVEFKILGQRFQSRSWLRLPSRGLKKEVPSSLAALERSVITRRHAR